MTKHKARICLFYCGFECPKIISCLICELPHKLFANSKEKTKFLHKCPFNVATYNISVKNYQFICT